jgi:tetratricopeptide (TPR) repeat protein
MKEPSSLTRTWKKTEELWDAADQAARKGDLLASEGKYEQALEWYERALKICPTHPDLWAFKAITLNGGLHRDEEARSAWKKARELDPALMDAFTEPDSTEVNVHLPGRAGVSCRTALRRLLEDSGNPRQ